MKNILTVTLFTFLLYSCAGLYSQPPEPVTSEYFTTFGGGFTMRISNSRELFYGINILSRKTLEPTNIMVITFQNPSSEIPFTKVSLVSDLESSNIVKNATTYILRSPLVEGVKQHTNYKITITLYKNSSKKELLATHEQLVNSSYTEN